MTMTAEPRIPDTTGKTHLEVIQELAADFATRSAQHDEDGTYPYENVDALRKVHHGRMMLPREFGGMGTPLPEAVHIMRALGKGDGPTALIVTQHHAVVANYSLQGLLYDNERLTRLAKEEFANDKWIGLFAGQPEFESRELATATRVDGGFMLNGRKGFGTSSRSADFGTGPFLWKKNEEESANVTVIYRTSDPGFRILDNWDTFGMRSTQSHDLEFTNVFVPDDDVVRISPIGGPGFGADNLQQNFFGFGLIFFASLYLGIADAAFDRAKEILAERTPLGSTTPSIMNPGLQSFLGEIDQKQREASAMLNWTVWEHRDPATWGADAFPSIIAMKDSVSRKAVEIVEMCMQAVGGPAYYRRSGLERLYRDVRGGPIHPFNHPATMAQLGRMAVPAHLLKK